MKWPASLLTHAINDAEHFLHALEGAGHEARLVGGIVRDYLAGRPLGDADIATTARPEEVTALFEARGLKVVLTGIAFGTVTVVQDGRGYEITTLREDIETDGRHAHVTYTKDWRKDAARRDFTINAMSRDVRGATHDYFGGQDDLKAGHVRFVGTPSERLKEDYLRLLRYFRFQQRFGKVLPEAETLAALRAAAPFLLRLSRERVWKELKQVLSAKNPAPTWALMEEVGAAEVLLPGQKGYKKLELLSVAQEKIASKKSDGVLSLAALLPEKMDARAAQERFALSGDEAKKLGLLLQNVREKTGQNAQVHLPTLAYHYGADFTREFMALSVVFGAEFDWESGAAMLENWQPKTFPLKGEDLLAQGMSSGPTLGAVLRQVEEWWIEKSFQPDKEKCLNKALEFLK